MAAINPIYKVKTDNKIDFYKHIIGVYCSLRGVDISKREKLILAWFIAEGYNKIVREKLISNKIVKSEGAMNVLMHKFRTLGFLTTKDYKEELCIDLQFDDCDLALINIVLDNR